MNILRLLWNIWDWTTGVMLTLIFALLAAVLAGILLTMLHPVAGLFGGLLTFAYFCRPWRELDEAWRNSGHR